MKNVEKKAEAAGWAGFIAFCYIWKILVIILHFIMGSPAKPENRKKKIIRKKKIYHKSCGPKCLIGLNKEGGK